LDEDRHELFKKIKTLTLKHLKKVPGGNEKANALSRAQENLPAVPVNDQNDMNIGSTASSVTNVIEMEAPLQSLSQPSPIRAEVIAEAADSRQLNNKYLMYMICIPPYSDENADLMKAGYHIGDVKRLKQRYSFLRQNISVWPVSEKLLCEADERLTGIGVNSARKFLMVSLFNYVVILYHVIIFNFV